MNVMKVNSQGLILYYERTVLRNGQTGFIKNIDQSFLLWQSKHYVNEALSTGHNRLLIISDKKAYQM